MYFQKRMLETEHYDAIGNEITGLIEAYKKI
jgi:hypothetical protein